MKPILAMGGHFGPILGVLEPFLKPILGMVGHFEPIPGVSGDPWAYYRGSRVIFQGHFGPILGGLGPFGPVSGSRMADLGPFGPISEGLKANLGPLGLFLGIFMANLRPVSGGVEAQFVAFRACLLGSKGQSQIGWSFNSITNVSYC